MTPADDPRGRLEPADAPGARGFASELARLLLGASGIALLAQLSLPVPLSPVPVTGQTLAVVLVGAWLGSWRGPVAVVIYLLAGCAGLPVFADGGAGYEHLTGPTGGFLAGFLPGAFLAGWSLEEAWARPARRILLVMIAAHAVILIIGGLRLAVLLGPQMAWARGIVPFLPGVALKSALATALVHFTRGSLEHRNQR